MSDTPNIVKMVSQKLISETATPHTGGWTHLIRNVGEDEYGQRWTFYSTHIFDARGNGRHGESYGYRLMLELP